MPVLHQYVNSEAFYLVRNFQGQFTTWQLREDAYRYLWQEELLYNNTDIGVNAFAYLRHSDMIYTGEGPPDPPPPLPRLSVSHHWQLTNSGVTLNIRGVSLFHHEYEGDAVLSIGEQIYRGVAWQGRFLGMPVHGVTISDLMPDEAGMMIRLEDAEDTYLAQKQLALLSRGSVLFKSARSCGEGFLRVDPNEITGTFPLGLCLLSENHTEPEGHGCILEERSDDWPGYALYTVHVGPNPAHPIILNAGDCRWTLHIRNLTYLYHSGEGVLRHEEICFTGERGVYPIKPDDPMILNIAGGPDDLANTTLRIETRDASVPLDITDLSQIMVAGRCNRFSLKRTLVENNIAETDGPITVYLEGPNCREDIRITFYPIPNTVELPPCRIGEHAQLILGGGETIFQSDNPLSLADGFCQNKVSGSISVGGRGTLTAAWPPVIQDALLVKDGATVIGGHTVTLSDLRRTGELLLLSQADRNWTVNIGEVSKSFRGPVRVLFIQLLNELDVSNAGITVPVKSWLDGLAVAEWALDLTPAVDELECCWTQEQESSSCKLNMQGAWFGCRGLSPRLVLYVDGHRMQAFPIGTGDGARSIAEFTFEKDFLIEAHQCGFYQDAGEIRLEAVFGECILAQVFVVPCPYGSPEVDPMRLKRMIRDVLEQSAQPDENADACYEQALYLTEQYAALTGVMPYSADALCAQLGTTPTSEAVKAGLYLMEALLSNQVLMRALPLILDVGGRCGMTELTLRIFYEVFLFTRGMGMPERLSEYTEKARECAATINNASLQHWAVAIASYGSETLQVADEEFPEAQVEAMGAPMLTFYAPFNEWLQR